jgi:murein DD-endopeptidase MepM/ murein hydrolase activator NlpD
LALALAIVGFLVFEPKTILQKWSDVGLFRMYAQNKDLQKTVNRLQDQSELAHKRLARMDSVRSQVSKEAGIPIPAAEVVEEEKDDNAFRFGMIGPAKNMNRIREAHRHFRHLVSFLEQNPQYARTLPVMQPLKHHKMVTGTFGFVNDPNTGFDVGHRGIDWATQEGDTIFAPGAGMIASIQNEKGFGLSITIVHNERVETFYAHLKSALVRPGQSVNRGAPIALVGNSGRSSGPHLHYEVRFMGQAVNPEDYFITP